MTWTVKGYKKHNQAEIFEKCHMITFFPPCNMKKRSF